MRTLVLGGTAWLGSHIVAHAVASDHEVTAFARGNAGSVPDGARFVRADRDGEHAFDGLDTETWDAVIDVSRQPGQVRRAVEALKDRTRHWVFVSSASVYADSATVGADEGAELFPPLEGDLMESMETFGPAKWRASGMCSAGWDRIAP